MGEQKTRFSFFHSEPKGPHYLRGVHDHPSVRSRILDGLKTFLFVAPLTVLIWIYAEREQLDTRRDIGVNIEVRTNQPDRIVTILSPENRRLFIDLSGPRVGLGTVSDTLSDSRKPLVLIVPEDIKPGFDGELNAAEQITRTDAFKASAVTITRVRPPVRIRVEAKASRKVPIRQSPQTKVVGDVTFEPDTAAIEGPASALAGLPQDELVLYADMSRFATRAKGKYEDTVPLSFPFAAENLTFPVSVKVKVDMRESVTVPLQVIPVLVQLPARFLDQDRFKITVSQPTLPNVNVSGPPEAIEQIKQGKFSPAAILELTPEEATTPGDKIKRLLPANYRMPKDVTVTNPEREISYTVTDRG